MSTQKNKIISPEEKNRVIGGMLYLVATPIAAEDTRNSGMLLSRFGISKPLVSYFEHNKKQRGEEIAARLENGESCALVTDAGTPAISDPGEDLVALCAERGIPVTSIPGACAAVTALSVSGLPTGRFVFEGFLTTMKSEKRRRLEALASEERTIILYEAPHKLRGTLEDLLKYWGDRRIALCREITKLNEEILRTTVSQAIRLYEDTDPRGEYVLIVEGAADAPTSSAAYPEDPVEHVDSLMEGGMERMDAIKAAAKARGMAKGEFYKLLLQAEEETE